MPKYDGPATIVAGDLEICVEAHLRTHTPGELSSWSGSVRADPSEDFYEVLVSNDVKIRLPDGRTGDIIPGRTTVGSGLLPIHGTGPAPF
ncbi:hypothetical protein [Streptomyces bullii]|uniref:DUF4873 domain-containing protein n=1 Tax=Streptomyces bullii TaxID=349910 RepID=A0ABW0US12_9ACTN